MPYILLGLSIGLEIAATTLLKYSAGFTKIIPTLGCLFAYFICYFLFSKALNSINLGAAYATWCAVGIVITGVISAFLFNQKFNAVGIFAIVLIIFGCILLNLFGTVK